MMAMYRFNANQELTPHAFPELLPPFEPVGLQAYLFFGYNSSHPNVSSEYQALNLDGLPTIFSSSGYQFTRFDGAESHFKPPLATFLLCNPHAHILDGEALLSQKNMSITLLSTSPISGQPKVGNISPKAANFALGLGMMDVLEANNADQPMRIGVFAAQAFTNNTSHNFNKSDANPFNVGILPLKDIQQNLDSFINPTGKALSSCIKNDKIEKTSHFFLIPAQGAIRKDKQALVTSQGLMLATIFLFFCITALLVINISYLHAWQRPPFKLKTLTLCIQKQDDKK